MIKICIKAMMLLLDDQPIYCVLNSLLADIVRFSGSRSGLLGCKHINTAGETVYRYYGIHGFDESSLIYKKFIEDGFLENNVHLRHVKSNSITVNNDLRLSHSYLPVGHPNITKAVFMSKDESLLLLGGTDNYNLQSKREDYDLYIQMCSIFLRLCFERESYVNDKALFLCKVTKELRTPVMSIITTNKKMQENLKQSHYQSRYLEVLNSCCLQLLDIVNDVIDYTSVLERSMKLRPVEAFSVEEFLQTIENFSAPNLAENVMLEMECEPGVPGVLYADKTRLIQLVLNMVHNSAFVTPENGRITLTVACNENNTCNENTIGIIFKVLDTSQGLPQRKLEKLFEISEDNKRGLGVGMIVARHIAEHYEGSLVVKNKDDQTGLQTICHVCLPRSCQTVLKKPNYVLLQTSENTGEDSLLYDALVAENFRPILAIDKDTVLNTIEKRIQDIQTIIVYEPSFIRLVRRITHGEIICISDNTAGFTVPNVTFVPTNYNIADLLAVLLHKTHLPWALVAVEEKKECQRITDMIENSYNVTQVHEGLDFFTELSKINRKKFGLIIADVDLPTLSPKKAMEKLQGSLAADTKIIYLERGVTSNSKRHLVMPVKKDELLMKVT